MVCQTPGVFFVLTEVKPNRNKVGLRDERDAAGLCVNCGCKPKADEVRRLGNCRTCYEDYRTANLALPAAKRAEFYAECVRDCLIMPNRQGQRIGTTNNFKAVAEKVKA